MDPLARSLAARIPAFQPVLPGVLPGGDTGGRPVPLGNLGKDQPSFGDTLTRALNEVSGAQDSAQDAVQRFARGEPIELHQVMAAQEEAGLTLELLVEVKNKFTEAYKTLVNMQT